MSNVRRIRPERDRSRAEEITTSAIAVVVGLLLFLLAVSPLVWLVTIVYGRIFS